MRASIMLEHTNFYNKIHLRQIFLLKTFLQEQVEVRAWPLKEFPFIDQARLT